jgi:hypothetical protein
MYQLWSATAALGRWSRANRDRREAARIQAPDDGDRSRRPTGDRPGRPAASGLTVVPGGRSARRTRFRRSAATTLVIAALAASVAACSSSSDTATAPAAAGGATATSTQAKPTAYCDAALEVETVGEPDIDFETATPEEMTAAMKSFATEKVLPLAKDALAAAPEEITADVATLVTAIEATARSGDVSVFEDAKVVEAEGVVHAFDLANCGWATVDVTTVDYEFEDLPASIGAGPTSFEISNEGTDVHEIVLMRKNDGVTLTAEELLALPEEEAMSKATFIGVGGPTVPGSTDYVVADLEAGNYVALCFLPVGMKAMDGPPPEGPPHFMEGMVAELTVT